MINNKAIVNVIHLALGDACNKFLATNDTNFHKFRHELRSFHEHRRKIVAQFVKICEICG